MKKKMNTTTTRGMDPSAENIY